MLMRLQRDGCRRSTRRRGERGYSSIEILGVLPIAILVAGAIFEIFLVVYSAIEAESAARLAAREASKGASTASAESSAESSIKAIYEPAASVAFGNQDATDEEPGVVSQALDEPVSATVAVTVPFLGFGLEPMDLTVIRHSVMPVTDD